MLKVWKTFWWIGFSFLVSACTEPFCSLDCQVPDQAPPIINQGNIDDFAKQNVILVSKGDYLKIIIPTDKFFRTNSPTLQQNKLQTMQKVANLLQSYGKNATVKVLGFTDTIQDDQQSKSLSFSRARSVVVYLWSQGLDAEHLYAIGLGRHNLVGDPNNVVANAANRRIEIIVQAHCTTCF